MDLCIILLLLFYCSIEGFHAGVIAETQSIKLLPGSGMPDDQFGYSVDISDDAIAVGAPHEDIDGKVDVGSVTIYRHLSNHWDDGVKILAHDGDEYDNFGHSVSIYKGRLLVGSPYDVDGGHWSGSAYICRYDVENQKWFQEMKLLPTDGASGDKFGYSVAMDADYVVIGTPAADNRNGRLSGAVYVFFRDGDEWIQQAKLAPKDGGWGDWFGGAVSISAKYIAVGASWADSNVPASGAAYIYKRVGNSWKQQIKIHPDNPVDSGLFGASIDIDDNRIIVGSISENNYRGAAYVYQQIGSFQNPIWRLESKLVAFAGKGGGMFKGNWFGSCVSLKGETVIVSSPFTNIVQLTTNSSMQFTDGRVPRSSGSAYLFKIVDRKWTEVKHLLAFDGDKSNEFGFALAMDNERAVISSISGTGRQPSGSAFVFHV